MTGDDRGHVPSPRMVGKVVAYITSGSRLLVMMHPDHQDAGIQVPAGTIERGESPRSAVIREAVEETGLTTFAAPVWLGMSTVDVRPWGRNEWHVRWFFRMEYPGPAPERWEHLELFARGEEEPIRLAFHWQPFGSVHLDGALDRFLGTLVAR